MSELPDLRRVDLIALDSETKDDGIGLDRGSAWPWRGGYVCGISVAYRGDGELRAHYFPIRHPDTENHNPEQVFQWLRDHVAAGVHFVTQNGVYDWGWLCVEAGIHMPAGEQLEEIGALATMVDENRFKYGLDELCAWRGLPTKDASRLLEGITALDLHKNKRRKLIPQEYIWQLPARYVEAYAEADAANTFALFESLDPVLDREGTRAAYRLEVDLLPMVAEMRLRGIRIDHPPLQQMPSRDSEITPLVRGVFLPEEGEVWVKPDASQQEFRLVVHYANQHKLHQAAEAVARYRDDPGTDFHALAATITGLERSAAKNVNFAKIYGAGVRKFATMINKPLAEAQHIYAQYDRELPFLRKLSDIYTGLARTQGHIVLYDGARRHFDRFAPGGKWEKGAGPCTLEEARARVCDPNHPWYRGGPLYRADTHTALNALIQGSAARHTKLWMRACWREGIVPLLQMHDCLDCSVNSREQAEMVARLGCEAVRLDVPMRIDLKYGRTWGDAAHTWDELNGATPQIAATVSTISIPAESPPVQPPPPQSPPPPPPPKSNGRYRSGDHDQPERGRVVAQYVYRDDGGRNYLLVKRYEWFTTAADGSSEKQKSFPQYRWTGTQWLKGCKGLHKIPFRLPELIATPRTTMVAICAGEKDVLTMVQLGYVATCNPGGEIPKAWTPELNCWFVGRTVLIVEDNDDTGRAHTREVEQALTGVTASIKVLRFPDVPAHEDVTWWVGQGHSKDELEARIAAAEPASDGTLESVRADQVTMRAITWLWLHRFAVGKIGIIAGLPDQGKGLILCYIAARITRALKWPNEEGVSPQGNVIILSAEEDPADSLAPRLAAAGADLSCIHFIKMVSDTDEKTKQPRKRMFSLVTDLEKLRRKILEVGDVTAVIIDPVSAYLGIGEVDNYRDTDVRAVLGPLKELAEEMRIAVITVMHFNKKADVTNAMLRVSNSMAFVGLPRHVYGVVGDPENARRLFVRAKNNDAAESDNQTMAFHVDARDVGTDPQTGALIRAPFVVWQPGYVDITATEAMQAAAESKAPGQRDAAKEFVKTLLGGGPVPVTEVDEAAEAAMISKRTLERAKVALKVVVYKDRSTPQGKWFWRLPT